MVFTIRKIGLTQKKIIIIGLIIIAAFLIFWFYIYLPNKNKANRIKSDLSGIQSQIQEIEESVGEAKTLGEGIKKIKEINQKLKAKFPAKEEEAFGMFSSITRGLNIEIISIEPQPKTAFLDENTKQVEVEGRVCQRVLVSIKLRSPYKDLVRYIEMLRGAFPALVTVERLKVNRDRFQDARLNIILELNLYLLS